MGRVLEDQEDAYGHAILDYFENGGGFEIIEREDGFVDISSGPSSYFASFNQWPEVEKKAISFAHGNVLDVGAGAGRVCLFLQEIGLQCLGIDNSPNALKVASERGVLNVRQIPFEDVEQVIEQFNTVTMFGNNFGLFGNREKARNMLKILHGVTSNDATIIAESVDPLQTDLQDHKEYQKSNRTKGKLPGQLYIRVLYRKFRTPWFEYLIVTQNEMKSILKGTGWHVSEFVTGKGPLYIGIIEKD